MKNRFPENIRVVKEISELMDVDPSTLSKADVGMLSALENAKDAIRVKHYGIHSLPGDVLCYENSLVEFVNDAIETGRNEVPYFGMFSHSGRREPFIVAQNPTEAILSDKKISVGYLFSDSLEFPVEIVRGKYKNDSFNMDGLLSITSHNMGSDDAELLTVRDTEGNPNPDLTPEEFEVLSNFGVRSLADFNRYYFLGVHAKNLMNSYIGSWVNGAKPDILDKLSEEHRKLVLPASMGEFVIYK